MKHSISKTFKSLNLSLLTLLLIATAMLLFIVEQYYSYEKIKALKSQKAVLSKILSVQNEAKSIDILKFNATIAKLSYKIDTLQKQSTHNYISNYLVNNDEEYNEDLSALKALLKTYESQSREYFLVEQDEKKRKAVLQSLEKTFTDTADTILSMMLKNITYDNARFDIYYKLFLALFSLLLLTTFIMSGRSSIILKDMQLLSSASSKNAKVYTAEADLILKRMKRKTSIADNPDLIDPITEINNIKGMLKAYSQRKVASNTTFSAVAVLEINNFSKSERKFTQEFIQEILKKVAFSISLHQQTADIIGRKDYNQFAILVVRSSKDALFRDIDFIRQSISEIKIEDAKRNLLQITITGAMVNKANNSPVEDGIRRAEDLLEKGRHLGKNRIIQVKDIPREV